MGSGRGVHGKENPRANYAVGLRTKPALLVRGSSRRITIMRFRPANIRVINRRENYLDRDSCERNASRAHAGGHLEAEKDPGLCVGKGYLKNHNADPYILVLLRLRATLDGTIRALRR